MFKFLLRIIAISLFIGILLFYFKPLSLFENNDYEKIMAKNEIVFATRIGPTTYYEIKGKNNGYGYDLMKGFADFLNVNLKIVIIENIDEAYTKLNNREIDIISDIDIRNYNNQIVKLSYPYNRIDHYIIFNSTYTSTLEKLSQLSNNTIHSIDSMTIKENMKGINSNYPDIKIKFWKEKNIDELLKLLNDNEIQYMVMNSDELKLLKQYYPTLEIAFKIDSNEPQSWVLPIDVGKTLEKQISDFFKYMINENKLLNIYAKHFRKHQHSFVGIKIFLDDYLNVFPKYEFFFRKFAKEYDLDWKLLASIGYQESRWREDAVSYTGVKGLMMLTTDTANEMKITDRTDPKESISGGTKYLKLLLGKLPKEITNDDKIWYAVAAYNIGLGHINDAIKLAKNDNVDYRKWPLIKPYILKLSQSKYYKYTKYGYARGWETVNYIQNIRQYYDILVFLDTQDDKDKNKNKNIPKSL